MMNQTSMAAIQRLYAAIVKVAINTHTPTLQPSNPPPVAAQELSVTVAPQETSYTLNITQVETPISPTAQETSCTPILNQVEPPISPTAQETSYTPILNQVEPPITPTAQETSYTQTKPNKTGRKSYHPQRTLQPAEHDTVNPIQPRPRKRKYDYMQKECPVHPGQTIFPILKILANRTSKEANPSATPIVVNLQCIDLVVKVAICNFLGGPTKFI
ncbi:uncharacterized protein [Salvelinus sp. IW2-2015]|uniref:uncharacterized protein n=1 Tax=Salvelinus sp. IW2-2015 TaxID=2691554 RepID=UPI0038D4E456